jgi:hypothetical protein
MATGEKELAEQRERERERAREQQINGVRDRAFDRNRHGVGWKWLLVKKDT